MICLRIGKTIEVKPYQVNFRSPFPRIHYYQSQVVTRIRNLNKPFGLSRNTNLQLNPYPNIQLDLYCNGNLLVQYTNFSTWLINNARIQVCDWHQQFEEDVGCKVLQFINDEDQETPWSQNPWRKDVVVSSKRIMNLGTFCICSPCMMAFKISLIYV